MAKYLQDFASGPLDRYRRLASFDWKKMKIFIESEPFIEYQVSYFAHDLNKLTTYLYILCTSTKYLKL